MLVTADAVIPINVTAVDAFGNVVTAYTGKVHFTSTDTKATLPVDYTFTAADAGTHTFNVGLHTATPHLGSWSVSVVDSKTPTSLATIPGFEVVNGVAAKIVLAVPSNVTAGTPFSLKVTVVDAWGNPVKNYFGTIHFADTAGLVGLPPDYTFTGADAGVANFTVTLNTTGNQTLSVTDVTNPLLQASAAVSVKTPVHDRRGEVVGVAVAAAGGRWVAVGRARRNPRPLTGGLCARMATTRPTNLMGIARVSSVG